LELRDIVPSLDNPLSHNLHGVPTAAHGQRFGL
jgi:hypothetical protein